MVLPQSGNISGECGQPGTGRCGEVGEAGVGGSAGGVPSAGRDFDDDCGEVAEVEGSRTFSIERRLLTGCGRGAWLDALNFISVLGFCQTHLVCILQVHPELFRSTEEAGEADGSIGADAAALEYDVIDARHRDMKSFRKLIRGHPDRKSVV